MNEKTKMEEKTRIVDTDLEITDPYNPTPIEAAHMIEKGWIHNGTIIRAQKTFSGYVSWNTEPISVQGGDIAIGDEEGGEITPGEINSLIDKVKAHPDSFDEHGFNARWVLEDTRGF